MQKRYIVIFSLLVISVLFIAGCQEAVGGRSGSVYGRSGSVYSSEASTVSEMHCPSVKVGGGASIRYNTGAVSCYKIVGCKDTQVTISDGITKSSTNSYTPVVSTAYGDLGQFCQGAPLYNEADVILTSGRGVSTSSNPFPGYPVRGTE